MFKIKKSLYKLSKIFMIITGLWKIPLSNDATMQKIYFMYSIFVQFMYLTYNLSLIIRMFQLLIQGAPGEILYTSVTLTILICEINYKMLVYLINGIPYKLSYVIEREKNIFASGNEEIKESYLNQAKYYIMVSSIQCSISFGGISYGVFYNVYKRIHNLFLPDESFLYELWFPFDKTKHDIFVSTYNVILAIFGFFFHCAILTTLQTLMVFAASQLRILQIRIRSMFDSSKGNETEDIATAKDLIKEHQFLIEFITSLNDGIKNILMLEFSLESINGAAAVLQIVSVATTLEFIYGWVYLSFILLNLLIMAWNCNEIMIQSGKIATAVYESKWMDQRETVKKLLHIIQMRAQIPLSLTIGPFGPMNTEVALMTVKGAYTYANMMLQTRK